jgi:hypothetical protein
MFPMNLDPCPAKIGCIKKETAQITGVIFELTMYASAFSVFQTGRLAWGRPGRQTIKPDWTMKTHRKLLFGMNSTLDGAARPDHIHTQDEDKFGKRPDRPIESNRFF